MTKIIRNNGTLRDLPRPIRRTIEGELINHRPPVTPAHTWTTAEVHETDVAGNTLNPEPVCLEPLASDRVPWWTWVLLALLGMSAGMIVGAWVGLL